MKIETDFLEKCNATLSRALDFYTASEMEVLSVKRIAQPISKSLKLY